MAIKKDRAKKFIRATQKHDYRLKPVDIRYIIELANLHPRWPVNRIFEEALRPRMQSALIVHITPKLKKALEKAAKRYQITILDVAYDAIEEWLKQKQLFE